MWKWILEYLHLVSKKDKYQVHPKTPCITKGILTPRETKNKLHRKYLKVPKEMSEKIYKKYQNRFNSKEKLLQS